MMNISISEDKLEYIKEMLFQGRKPDAIKLYQESAVEKNMIVAQIAIEKLENELQASSPEKFMPSAQVKSSRGITGAGKVRSNYELQFPLFWKIVLTVASAILGGILILYFRVW